MGEYIILQLDQKQMFYQNMVLILKISFNNIFLKTFFCSTFPISEIPAVSFHAFELKNIIKHDVNIFGFECWIALAHSAIIIFYRPCRSYHITCFNIFFTCVSCLELKNTSLHC